MRPADVRRIALALPDVEERETWGEPTFRVQGRIFAVVDRSTGSASIKARKEHQHSIIASDPRTFSVAPYVGRFGWVLARLDTLGLEAMRVLITDAWRLTAPKRVVAAFETVKEGLERKAPNPRGSRKSARAKKTPTRVTNPGSAAGDLEMLEFESGAAFRRWLERHHERRQGIWLRIYKKESGVPTVTYSDALDEALCFGWIDGQRKAVDSKSFKQRFTPRRPRSAWSKRNTEHAERLIKAGKMRPAGIAQIEAAKADGRWQAAYDAFGSAAVPEDFLAALRKHREAHDFFKTLNKTNLYSIVYRLQTAKKPETRARRFEQIIERLSRGEKFH